MIFNWFKKRFNNKKFRSESGISAATAGHDEEPTVALPWRDGADDAVPASSAAGCLREFLLASLTTEKGVHAETLMVVVGALAGFSAQHAVWETIVKPGKPIAPGGFRDIKTRSGEVFYSGDLLNGFLAPQPGADFPIWGIIAGAAVEAGAPRSELPSYKEILNYVERTMGAPEFGLPRAPEEHRPGATPRDALNVFWPQTKMILSRSDFPGAAGVSLPPEHWPAVIGTVAQQYIAMTKDVLDPRVSLRLIMEAAAPMSKIDPDTVRQAPTLPRRLR
jgi:hypothetical protein